jgi:hypothetical protein
MSNKLVEAAHQCGVFRKSRCPLALLPLRLLSRPWCPNSGRGRRKPSVGAREDLSLFRWFSQCRCLEDQAMCSLTEAGIRSFPRLPCDIRDESCILPRRGKGPCQFVSLGGRSYLLEDFGTDLSAKAALQLQTRCT